MRAAVPYAFDELRIALLVAHFHPDNTRSRRLLERAGFAIQEAPGVLCAPMQSRYCTAVLAGT